MRDCCKADGVLQKPLLYLSLFLKTHRTDYYRLLQEVREHGHWEAWLDFFLVGVAETANQAFDAATRIVDLFKEDRERITAASEAASSAIAYTSPFLARAPIRCPPPPEQRKPGRLHPPTAPRPDQKAARRSISIAFGVPHSEQQARDARLVDICRIAPNCGQGGLDPRRGGLARHARHTEILGPGRHLGQLR